MGEVYKRAIATRCVGVGLLILVGFPALAQAQENRCVACHFRIAVEEPGLSASRIDLSAHLDEWETSAHAAAQVGCDACHRGEPEATTLAAAHQGVLSSGNPASPVHLANIAATCGGCHAGQLTAFQTSRHYQLLEAGQRFAPTCMTCHGAVAARLPSTRVITGQCATCHGPEGVAPISEHQELVRLMRERIQEHRYSLALVRMVIDRTDDADRRAMLTERYDEVEGPLTAAVAAWHAFAFDRAAAPLATAGALLDDMVRDLTPR
jgi:hypothetical protein